MSQILLVKQVLSGDTFVAVNSSGKESIIGLSGILAPRFSTSANAAGNNIVSEPWGFEARDYLRRNLVGKKVSFLGGSTAATNNASAVVDENKKVYGVVSLQGDNVAERMVSAGLARVKDEEKNSLGLLSFQEKAQSEQKGIWSDGQVPKVPSILSLAPGKGPLDPAAFLAKYKGLKLANAVIEYVRDGSFLRLLVPINLNDNTSDYDLISLPIQMTGITTPVLRVNVPGREDLIEAFSQDAKAFTESRLLQRQVQLVLDGISSGSGMSFLYGTLIHPNGIISVELAKNGLAQVHDWSIALVSDSEIAKSIRVAEKLAKSNKLRLWENLTSAPASSQTSEWSGKVVKIWSGDSISVQPIASKNTAPVRIFLSSIRQPKSVKADGSAAGALSEIGYAFQAKEFLRSRSIGKTVKVCVDHVVVPEKDQNFPPRTCATVFLESNQNICLNVALVSKGLASVIRHKKDDKDKSSQYEQLIQSEVKATSEKRGIFADSEPPIVKLNDASENGQKAKTIFAILQRKGKLTGMVDHVFSARKLAIVLIKDGVRLNLLLSGVRTPGQGEPFNEEANEFVFNKINQRNVTITLESVDPKGNFSGLVFYSATDKTNVSASLDHIPNENHADCLNVDLLAVGLASIHGPSADACPISNLLYAAEDKAASAHLNLWSLEQENEVKIQEAKEKDQLNDMSQWNADKLQAVPIIVTEVKSVTSFYFQTRNPELTEFEKMMSSFQSFNVSSSVTSKPVTGKEGERVSAVFHADSKWYRAQIVRRLDHTRVLIRFIDYGNEQECKISDLRPLPSEFSNLGNQAQLARLVYLQEPEAQHLEASQQKDGFNFVTDWIGKHSKNLMVKIYGSPSGAFSNVLAYDGPQCLNVELARQGYSYLDPVIGKTIRNQDPLLHAIEEAQKQAKRSRSGVWIYGDFLDD